MNNKENENFYITPNTVPILCFTYILDFILAPRQNFSPLRMWEVDKSISSLVWVGERFLVSSGCLQPDS